MQIGMIGLGKMGGNMARRLRAADIDVVGYNLDKQATSALAAETGLIAADSTSDLVDKLEGPELRGPRIVWLMLPAGKVTEATVQEVAAQLQPGDIIVDGANSWYKDSMRRGALLTQQGLQFVDAGVSGGVWGLDNGYAMMLGGDAAAIETLRPVIEALAPAANRGWVHTGPVGSGHFAKMIHNGIEYGMMQAYAEGFALLEGRDDFDLNLAEIAESWRHGSVIRSWLLDLTAEALTEGDDLESIEPYVADSGEGRWTAIEGIEQGVPTPVMSTALMVRFASQGQQDFASRLLAVMRNRFGGHATRPAGD